MYEGIVKKIFNLNGILPFFSMLVVFKIPVEIIDVISAVIIYFSSFALMIRLYLQNRDKKKHKRETAIEGGQE